MEHPWEAVQPRKQGGPQLFRVQPNLRDRNTSHKYISTQQMSNTTVSAVQQQRRSAAGYTPVNSLIALRAELRSRGRTAS